MDETPVTAVHGPQPVINRCRRRCRTSRPTHRSARPRLSGDDSGGIGAAEFRRRSRVQRGR